MWGREVAAEMGNFVLNLRRVMMVLPIRVEPVTRPVTKIAVVRARDLSAEMVMFAPRLKCVTMALKTNVVPVTPIAVAKESGSYVVIRWSVLRLRRVMMGIQTSAVLVILIVLMSA
jgi:hypothetical protein